MPRRTSCLLLALVVLSVAAGASARQHSGGGGVLDGGLPPHLKPDVIVAKPGGRGDVTTIADALMRAPGPGDGKSPTGRRHFVIHIREGVYVEHVLVATANVVLMGDGREKTIITGGLSNRTGHNVHDSATLTAKAEGFMALDLCIRNTAGGLHDNQAVALFSDSNHSIFFRCDIQGYQDTLLANTGLQFYRECRIWGTVDFVFGNAAAVFQQCELYARRPADQDQHGVITAQGREDHDGPTGFVFHECTVAPSALPGEGLERGMQTFLGRPWRHHALVVFIRCSIDSVVHADGWVSWSKDRQAGGNDPAPGHHNHIYFAEYDNQVRGIAKKVLVHWKGFTAISKNEARNFMPKVFFHGDKWIRRSGVPYHAGL